ncbi:MAG: hypothetical protein ACYC26_15115 [Phycisphaerales bacterium]
MTTFGTRYCTVRINVEKVRENLSKGVTWKRRIAVSEEQALEQLELIGFTRNEDGLTFTARQADLPALRPGELMSFAPLAGESKQRNKQRN